MPAAFRVYDLTSAPSWHHMCCVQRAVELANANQGHWHNLWYCVFCKTPNGEPLHYCSHCPAAFHWACYQQKTGCTVPREDVPESWFWCISCDEKHGSEHPQRLDKLSQPPPMPPRRTRPAQGFPADDSEQVAI
jgi:hypothetical protein